MLETVSANHVSQTSQQKLKQDTQHVQKLEENKKILIWEREHKHGLRATNYTTMAQ